MVSALLRWSRATCATCVMLNGNRVTVVRDVENGSETLKLCLPAVITIDLGLAEPRYASLPNIMQARRKPIVRILPEELGVEVAPRLITLNVIEPNQRRAGVIVADISELVERLRQEARVIS